MNTLQTWILIGVPALVLSAGLFAGRSALRAAFGYLVLSATFLTFLLVPRSPVSAVLIGAVGFLLVAAGKGDLAVEAERDGSEVPMRVGDPEVDDIRTV